MAIEQDWWNNRLAEDIYATLRLKEQTLPTFKLTSPQLWVRRHLVDWLADIVIELEICETAQHLAIYLLDRCMEEIKIKESYLHLIAVTCLLLAAKFEEQYDKIPLCTKFNKYLHMNLFNDGQPYTPRQYLNMEVFILKFCRFELCIPTVAHFLPYFLKVAVDEDDLRYGIPIFCKTIIETSLEKHAIYFQEIVLQDVMYREFAPSLVAAACVAASRICAHLTPTWPRQLELMTYYYLEELLPCVHSMLTTHQSDSMCASNNSPQPVSTQPVFTAQSCIPSIGQNWNNLSSNNSGHPFNHSSLHLNSGSFPSNTSPIPVNTSFPWNNSSLHWNINSIHLNARSLSLDTNALPLNTSSLPLNNDSPFEQ